MDVVNVAFNDILSNCVLACQRHDWDQLDTVFSLLVSSYHTDGQARRITFTEKHCQQIYELFSTIDGNLPVVAELPDSCYYNLMGNLFRFLRNSCAGNSQNTQLILEQGSLLHNAISCIRQKFMHHDLFILEEVLPTKAAAFRCALQFFANLVGGLASSGSKIRRYVWTQFKFEFLSDLMTNSPTQVRKISTAIVYNCLLDREILDELVADPNELRDIVSLMVRELQHEHPSEWSLFTIQLLLDKDVIRVLALLPELDRVPFVDILIEMVREESGKEIEEPTLNQSNINQIIKIFNLRILAIASNKYKDWSNKDKRLFHALLKLVCEIISSDTCWNTASTLEAVSPFFKTVIRGLAIIHKASGSRRLKDTGRLAGLDPRELLLYTKKDLVRLIVFLLHRLPKLKDLAAECDAVPLILDLCKHDVNNPFIREWAIVTTYYLLDNHPANQSILHNLTKDHVFTDPEVIKKLNLEIVNGRIVPRDRMPNNYATLG